MACRINTALLCAVLALLIYSLLRKAPQAGRFQWLDTPGKQLAFDTATGQRCWVWTETSPVPNDQIPVCAELARKAK
jgi:hypothetical protein